MNKKSIFCLIPSILFSLLCSCNKDEVIEEDNSGNNGFRPLTSSSSKEINKVYSWIPAPGQFINDFGNDFSNSDEISPQEANEWALQRLMENKFISLGAFGGYVVAGFDHSIQNTGEYEIGIFGNAFMSSNGASNEPGIVYVMKDENMNGLPDDTWYELKGSDTFAPGTIPDYQVTYYRPDGPGKAVEWTDNLGDSGEIKYFESFHNQPYYYPVWIKEDSYTLSGTCLKAKTLQSPETGNWENPPFKWGYADNIGEDNIELDGVKNCNRFRISDAINQDGTSINLDYIDFVKIQTGVCANSGWLGEVSTEILGIIDLNPELIMK